MEFSTTTEVMRVAEYLTRIADGLREGCVNLVASGQTIVLEPADIVRLQMEAKRLPGQRRTSLELEISWTTVTSRRQDRSPDLLLSTTA
jgi:amphi-Trp domain-containing protein